MEVEKKITLERIHELAENAVKVTPRTNSSKLFNALSKKSKISDIKNLSKELNRVLYDSLVETQVYNPESLEETKTRCIDQLVIAVSELTGIEYTEKREGRGKSSLTDYMFEARHNGITNRLVIEAKSFNNSIFTAKHRLNISKASQSCRKTTSNSNGEGYGLMILTNGRELAVFLQGVTECTSPLSKGWQPLRDISKPILTMSCYEITDKQCDVLAYLIYNTLVGKHSLVIDTVKNVFEEEVEKLVHEFENRGFVVEE